MAESVLSELKTGYADRLWDDSDNLGPFTNLERKILLQLSSRYKKIKFKEEEEIRITFDDELETSNDNWDEAYNWGQEKTLHTSSKIEKLFPKALQFRSTNNDIISYLDLRFDINTNDDNKIYLEDKSSAINEIIIGANCKLIETDIK